MSVLSNFEIGRRERELAEERRIAAARQAEPAPTAPVVAMDAALVERLVAVLERVAVALERRPDPSGERLAYRIEELATALGVSRRALDRDRSSGSFPPPDRIIGSKTQIWSRETIDAWLSSEKK